MRGLSCLVLLLVKPSRLKALGECCFQVFRHYHVLQGTVRRPINGTTHMLGREEAEQGPVRGKASIEPKGSNGPVSIGRLTG